MKHLFAITFAAIALVSSAKYQEDLIPGGQLIKPGTYIKSIAFVDAQNLLPESEVRSVAEFIDDETGFCVKTVKMETTDPATIKAAVDSDIFIILKNDPKSPTLLIAPEDRWAIVNFANLVDDLPAARAKQKFFIPRARKEIIKAFSLLCGGGSSQFPSNIMNTTCPRELDKVKEQIPTDMLNNYIEYLGKLGYKPKELIPYEIACEEGWAPAPTNEVQKTLWNRVREPPSEPLKIKFEKK